MPFEFKCRNCGKIIAVTILNTGEQAFCRNCNTINIVPDKNVQYTDIPVGLTPGDPKLQAPIPGQSVEKSGVAPRTITEVIGETFQVYFKIFWKACAIYAMVLFPSVAISYFVEQMVQRPDFTNFNAGTLIAVFAAFSSNLLFNILVGPLAAGAIFYLVISNYTGKKPGIIQALRIAVGKATVLIPTSLLVSFIAIIVIIVPILGIFFTIYLSVIWSLFIGAVILDNKGIIDSMKRSKSLTDDYWWNIFGTYLLFIIILIIPYLVTLFMPRVIGILISLVVLTVPQIITVIIYLNQRTIKEGYTNDQLREDILKLEAETARSES